MLFHVFQSSLDDNQCKVTAKKLIENLIASLSENLAKVELKGENLIFSLISKMYSHTLSIKFPFSFIHSIAVPLQDLPFPSPLPHSLLPSSPIFEANWPTASQWWMGFAHIAVSIGEEVIIWGGTQNQTGDAVNDQDDEVFLPSDAVFGLCFTLDATWRRIPASGKVPPSTQYAAAVVCNGTIYVFGGLRSEGHTNDLHTLSSTGVFAKLTPVGVAPAPRDSHCGWSFDGMIYYLGVQGPTRQLANIWFEVNAKESAIISCCSFRRRQTPSPSSPRLGRLHRRYIIMPWPRSTVWST
jgi:hypothetical protein